MGFSVFSAVDEYGGLARTVYRGVRAFLIFDKLVKGVLVLRQLEYDKCNKKEEEQIKLFLKLSIFQDFEEKA